MNQPYLFRDALSVVCQQCGAIIQAGETNAPIAGGICEECERIDKEMRLFYQGFIRGWNRMAMEAYKHDHP